MGYSPSSSSAEHMEEEHRDKLILDADKSESAVERWALIKAVTPQCCKSPTGGGRLIMTAPTAAGGADSRPDYDTARPGITLVN